MTKNCLLVALLVVVAACSKPPTPPPAARPPQTVEIVHTFDIPGSEDVGPSLAARGARAVVAWAATRDGRTDVFAAVSDDGGATFGSPVRVNDLAGDAHVSGEQPPRAALGRDDIVVAWVSRTDQESRIRLARSTDGGRTFQPARTLHAEALTGARGWESIAVDADDNVHALWLDGRHATVASRSSSHAHAHAAPGQPMPAMPAMSAPEQDIVEATLSASGQLTETQVASNVCFCCKTAMAIAPDQTVFAAWRHIYPNSIRDIAVARSSDHGRVFSEPSRVSVDNWKLDGCPDDGPAMVVDAENLLHIVWPTQVDGPKPQKGIFYAFSADGGRTFSERVRLDDPAVGNAAHPQIALDSRGVVATWDEYAHDLRSVRVREIELHASATGRTPHVADTVTASGATAATYPVVGSTTTGVLIAWTAGKGDTTIQVGRLSR